jgi:SAM-dependent methyltransferase
VNERLVEVGKRFARVATRVAVANPRLWRLFRGPLRAMFDWLAPGWEERRAGEDLASLDAALARIDREPGRVLDVGTGTGLAARFLARRFPEAEVVAVDLSPRMIDEARRVLPAELAGRVNFAVADASALPFGDGEFDLVVLVAMIPFFEELGRVTAPGGWIVFAWPAGAETPIYTPPETLRERLTPLGFESFDDVEVDGATALFARRRAGD